MDNFYLIRNKKTGVVSKMLNLPYMGQNSDFERLDPDTYFKKSKLPAVDNDDLTAGAESGEDSR